MDSLGLDRLVEVQALEGLLTALAQGLRSQRWRLVTAESCTGGLVAAACTSIAGSSDWFERGYVTYSNEAKTESLGVPAELIERHGAVSREVAMAMVMGALQRSGAQVGVATTGIAGPGGGSPRKPVGTVWFAWARAQDFVEAECRHFPGDRTRVRAAATRHALQRVRSLLEATA
ncbi:CinA family protein [Caldimonas caldifontis]|uniref:Damage-inducible protein CinA n=1 Tax=Caldimonas caldifontis TaxID=1452508 RepID=A0A2S5SU69_9BURK|nr:CinA family protein [Caldimonas caldifontis]PPE66246.1 damage-inducible protein CinA [Caldimonas caldifontis]